MSDVLTKEQRQRNMKNIKSKDTEIECVLRKVLWNKGIRYRKNYKHLTGKPDIVIRKYRIAIFCDSEFFHGKDWERQKERLAKGDNGLFWVTKIEKNIERDREVDRVLASEGWKVLRFWGNDIKKHTMECVKAVEEAIFDSKIIL